MPNLDNLRKQAKLLVRWHREGNYSIGGRIRGLARYQNLTDREALTLKFPLSEAQEIIAVENGYESWAALKSALPTRADSPKPVASATIKSAAPMLFVSNVETTAEFFRDKLGFAINFLHGHPPFYGAVSRGGACLHLRFVHRSPFAEGIQKEESLLSAFIAVEGIKQLYVEFKSNGVPFQDELKKEAWGRAAFTVIDPDGNWICFAE